MHITNELSLFKLAHLADGISRRFHLSAFLTIPDRTEFPQSRKHSALSTLAGAPSQSTLIRLKHTVFKT